MSPEEYAEHKMSAEGKAELTEPDVEDFEEDVGTITDGDEAWMREEEARWRRVTEISPELKAQLEGMTHYVRLVIEGDKEDNRIGLYVMVKDTDLDSEYLFMQMERPGYNFGTLRQLNVRYGGVYAHSLEAARQVERLEREEGFLIDYINFYSR